jgi:hypothetical protein
MISNIPEELKALQQWVCFDITDNKKVPFTPGTESMAASNRPRDWRSFRAALADVESGKRQHVGFCFSSSDPYTFIDLDDPDDADQAAIFRRLDTYAQRSVSGEGCHLICKGTFEGAGKHPASPAAGLFKENRFCLMTGGVVNGRATIKVVADDDLQAVHRWLGGGNDHEKEELVEYESEIPDQTVVEMGCDRFDKFASLCNGDWQKYEEYHNDHSTADHAFIAMLCDLTECNEQVRKLFSFSLMWSEERAAKKAGHGLNGYVDRTIQKIRANQRRSESLRSRVKLTFMEVEEPKRVEPLTTKTNLIETLPDGLVKDIARYSFQSAYFPLQEASLGLALSAMSVICGRSYLTPSKQGLNLWLILVGPSSCGKDEFQDGIGRLFGALHKRGLKSPTDLFGGELASGEAIEQIFSNRKRYLSYMTEFGKKFKQIVAPHAPPHIDNLKRGLLNSFNSAGINGAVRTREKAQRGENDVRVIERPCLVVAGETVPETLYGTMTQGDADDGFLQRFILLNVDSESWSSKANKGYGKLPPKGLLDTLERLVMLVDTFDVDNSVKHKEAIVVEANPDAREMFDAFEFQKRECNRRGEGSPADRELGNRAALKAWRLATLLAVSADFYAPRITVEHLRWAVSFVTHCDNALASKFKTGEVGSGQTKQESEIRKAAKYLCGLEVKRKRSLGMNKEVAAQPDLLPMSVLKDHVVQSAAFANDKSGAVTSFEKAVDSLARAGFFVKLKEDYAMDNFSHTKGLLLCVK